MWGWYYDWKTEAQFHIFTSVSFRFACRDQMNCCPSPVLLFESKEKILPLSALWGILYTSLPAGAASEQPSPISSSDINRSIASEHQTSTRQWQQADTRGTTEEDAEVLVMELACDVSRSFLSGGSLQLPSSWLCGFCPTLWCRTSVCKFT